MESPKEGIEPWDAPDPERLKNPPARQRAADLVAPGPPRPSLAGVDAPLPASLTAPPMAAALPGAATARRSLGPVSDFEPFPEVTGTGAAAPALDAAAEGPSEDDELHAPGFDLGLDQIDTGPIIRTRSRRVWPAAVALLGVGAALAAWLLVGSPAFDDSAPDAQIADVAAPVEAAPEPVEAVAAPESVEPLTAKATAAAEQKAVAPVVATPRRRRSAAASPKKPSATSGSSHVARRAPPVMLVRPKDAPLATQPAAAPIPAVVQPPPPVEVVEPTAPPAPQASSDPTDVWGG